MTSKREIAYSDWLDRDDGVEELYAVADESWDELETLDGALERVTSRERDPIQPPLRLKIYLRELLQSVVVFVTEHDVAALESVKQQLDESSSLLERLQGKYGA